MVLCSLQYHLYRVLDGVPATIDVLEEIVTAARDVNMEVYLDGGIRTGMDVFKAIAMGLYCHLMIHNKAQLP